MRCAAMRCHALPCVRRLGIRAAASSRSGVSALMLMESGTAATSSRDFVATVSATNYRPLFSALAGHDRLSACASLPLPTSTCFVELGKKRST